MITVTLQQLEDFEKVVAGAPKRYTGNHSKKVHTQRLQQPQTSTVVRSAGRKTLQSDTASCDGRLEENKSASPLGQDLQVVIEALREQLRQENLLRFRSESKAIQLAEENKQLKQQLDHPAPNSPKAAETAVCDVPVAPQLNEGALSLLDIQSMLRQENFTLADLPVLMQIQQQLQQLQQERLSQSTCNPNEDSVLDTLELWFNQCNQFIDKMEQELPKLSSTPLSTPRAQDATVAPERPPLRLVHFNVFLHQWLRNVENVELWPQSTVLDTSSKNLIGMRLKEMFRL